MKFLIVLITAFFITVIAGAQHSDSPAGHVNIGIKAGVNIFNIYNDNSTNYDPLVGYHFGLLGHIHINSQFAFQPEIVYSAQGAKFSEDTGYNLGYINIPVLLQYMFDNGFRLQAGPQAGFLISAKTINNGNTTDHKDDLKPIDLGVSIGASYIYPPSGIGVDLRYNVGFSNINKNSSVN